MNGDCLARGAGRLASRGVSLLWLRRQSTTGLGASRTTENSSQFRRLQDRDVPDSVAVWTAGSSLCLCMVERSCGVDGWPLSVSLHGGERVSLLKGHRSSHAVPTLRTSRKPNQLQSPSHLGLGIWGRHNSVCAGISWALAGPVLRPRPESPDSLGSKRGKDWGPGA